MYRFCFFDREFFQLVRVFSISSIDMWGAFYDVQVEAERILRTTTTACCRPSNLKNLPAEPHYKFILFIGEANTLQAGSKPNVACRVIGSIFQVAISLFRSSSLF